MGFTRTNNERSELIYGDIERWGSGNVKVTARLCELFQFQVFKGTAAKIRGKKK